MNTVQHTTLPNGRKLVPVAEILGFTLYAARTEAGGVCFYEDSCGIIAELVDMTVADPYMLRLALDLWPMLDRQLPGEVKDSKIEVVDEDVGC
jgi:hypothetical protein